MVRAQSVVEYGLLLATVAVLVLVGANAFGVVLYAWFGGLIVRVVSVGT